MISVAIDGPSGAGKSTLAKQLAQRLGFLYLDTGAMYRAIGLHGLNMGIDIQDSKQVETLLQDIEIGLEFQQGVQHIYLNQQDVSEQIRTEKAGMAACAVASQTAVREFLLNLQRDMAKKYNILMDGRDIGTVILPHATVKIYLTASVKARAERRFAQLQQKGQNVDFETVKQDIEQRDYQDMHRQTAPLKKAADAVELDTSELSLEQSFEAMLEIIQQKINLPQ